MAEREFPLWVQAAWREWTGSTARVLTGVRKRFGVSITLDRLYEVQTVRAMAACVEAARDGDEEGSR